MRLLELTEDKQVALNKVFVATIPEFKALVTRDKSRDSRGYTRAKATKELTFIYFYCDFNSPIRDWEDDERKKEALYYAQLKEEDLDTEVMTANQKYFDLQLAASRPLRTLKALYKGLDAMDNYFESIDFSKVDKQGKLLNSPTDFVNNAAKLNKMYDEVRNFEKRVEADLIEQAGIRGPNSSLGDTEGQGKKPWSELDIQQGSEHTKQVIPSTTSFKALLEITKVQAREELKQENLQKALNNPELAVIFGEAKEELEEEEE